MNIFPIGIHDIDREILFYVPHKELFAACLVNKYIQDCCNEIFWKNRFIKDFQIHLDKYTHQTYKNLYKKLKRLNNEQLLKISIKKGYIPLVKSLMVNIKLCNEYLYLAAKHGRLNIIKYFIKIFRIKQRTYENMLLIATKYGHLNIITYIVGGKSRKTINIHFNDDILFSTAASKGYLHIMRYFIEDSPKIDIHTGDEMALRFAASEGHLDVVKYLVGRGADIHEYDDEALDSAAFGGYLDVVQYLIEHGANIFGNDSGILYSATKNGHLNVIKYLVENVIEPQKNPHPLLYRCVDEAYKLAAELGYTEIVIYFVQYYNSKSVNLTI
jgi:ankyrin repeat protein